MAKPATQRSSAYDVHPGVAMVQKWVAELKPKTGRSLDEWIALVQEEGPEDHAARRVWLKSKHKLGTNSAWWIAERADGIGGEETRQKNTSWRLRNTWKSNTRGKNPRFFRFLRN